MANALIHKAPQKIAGAIAAAIENQAQHIVNLDNNWNNKAEQLSSKLEGIKSAIEATNKSTLTCSPNPDCLTILYYAYTIGASILGGEKNFNLKECNDLLKACSKSEQYNHCMEILKENDDLAYQSSQLSKPLPKASLECRTERINMLNLLIFEVIIWYQQKRSEESSRATD